MLNPLHNAGLLSISSGLDVLVRFHDFTRGHELRRCILSLVCQNYDPLHVHVITQRFSPDQIQALNEMLAPFLQLNTRIELKIWNYVKPEPKDARSALLNLGVNMATGRYLAILDCDDTIYPESYTALIRDLQSSEAAITFGGIASKTVERFQDALMTHKKERHFVGRDLIDLFHDNFCPIHSFVLDRSKVTGGDIWFDEESTRLEDYEFLLRFTSKYLSSFALISRIVGDYYFKTDGSNTIYLGFSNQTMKQMEWRRAKERIEKLRSSTVLSDHVQRSLGSVPPDPSMTIQKVLTKFHR